ncbi:MAG: hypothetical protein HeimC2_37750 [Candidatus Heimdallarchaeota archaeon LC_2]|nr:MAG: hypothetical protein HeimC2_37750 [Candidatus Heimdallarchaeota archaeon LC_2]
MKKRGASVQFRISPEKKDLWNKACKYEGKSMTAFIENIVDDYIAGKKLIMDIEDLFKKYNK